jgi:hypothetical protein
MPTAVCAIHIPEALSINVFKHTTINTKRLASGMEI